MSHVLLEQSRLQSWETSCVPLAILEATKPPEDHHQSQPKGSYRIHKKSHPSLWIVPHPYTLKPHKAQLYPSVKIVKAAQIFRLQQEQWA